MLVLQGVISHSLSFANSAAYVLSLSNLIMIVVILGLTVLGIHSMVAGAGPLSCIFLKSASSVTVSSLSFFCLLAHCHACV